MSKIFNTQSGRFEFKSQNNPGRPEDEVWASMRFVPANFSGEIVTLTFQHDNYYVMRGWMNSALDGFVRGMYENRKDGQLALYVERNDKRLNGGLGWGMSSLFDPPTDGIWGKWSLDGQVFNVQHPCRLNDDKIKVPVDLTSWVFLYKRSPSEIVLENTWKNARTGESAAELKHEALRSLFDGVSFSVPVTIGTANDGRLLDGLQNKAKLMVQELSLLESGQATQADLRDQELARKSEFNQEAKATRRTEVAQQVREANGDPEPEVDGLKVRINGNVRKLANLEDGYYKIYCLSTNGKRLSSPEYAMKMVRSDSAFALSIAHPETYDLEPLEL